MIQELETVKIKTGEAMQVKLITPPAEKYIELLSHFLEHKTDNALRDIKQRLRGDYIDLCVDKYIIGEIDGRIASQMWYGYPVNGTGIGNFGHVYTELEHRKKGITNELMRFFTDDFKKSPVNAIFCGAGSPWVAKIYTNHGFQLVKDGVDAESLVLIKKGYAGNFKEIAEKYFKRGLNIKVVNGSIKQRHDIDKLLENALMLKEISWNRISMAYNVPSYRDACFMVEDQKGLITCATTSIGSMVGWSFILNTGSPLEQKSKIFDYVLHPNYSEQTGEFIKKSLEIAYINNIRKIYSYISSFETNKINNLVNEGFKETARLKDYCKDNEKMFDLVILEIKK